MLAQITQEPVISRILEHIGFPGEPLICKPARAPPQIVEQAASSEEESIDSSTITIEPESQEMPESDENIDFLPPDEWSFIEEYYED
jgi:hypothetical protein